jgi:hypothetical protein
MGSADIEILVDVWQRLLLTDPRKDGSTASSVSDP